MRYTDGHDVPDDPDDPGDPDDSDGPNDPDGPDDLVAILLCANVIQLYIHGLSIFLHQRSFPNFEIYPRKSA